MTRFTDKAIQDTFAGYPEAVRKKLLVLRELIFATAQAADGIGDIEESLKWGQPSYTTQGASAVRLGWSKNRPDRYAMYFHCQTKLVDTFKEIYRNEFTFEGNRAILFQLSEELPVEELKHCILLSLTYHRRKHLPLLGE